MAGMIFKNLTDRLRNNLHGRSTVWSGPSLDFGLVGAAGWIARVHLDALHRAGHRVMVAMDPSDAGIAILDELFPDALFLRSEAELERFLRSPEGRSAVRFLSICSPDYLHRAHIEIALRAGVDAVCEKPLVIDPAELEALENLEESTGRRVYPIMQQRYNPAILELMRSSKSQTKQDSAQVELTYVTHRGPWYQASWRGQEEQSGGLAMDIGIHFFDLMTWLYGEVQSNEVHMRTSQAIGGYTELDRASVHWFLSIDRRHLPENEAARGVRHLRSMRVDGREVELSRGMKHLHAQSFREIALGRGLRISDVRPGLVLAAAVQRCELSTAGHGRAHHLTQSLLER